MGIKREVEVSIQRDEDEDQNGELGARPAGSGTGGVDESASERSWEADLEAGADGHGEMGRGRNGGRGF